MAKRIFGTPLIVNRLTPPHKDPGSALTHYDLLLSVGTHKSARIQLHDVQASLSYHPGTAVLLCGRIILHEVSSWEGGERICLAHYVRDMVHDRLGLDRPDWVSGKDYTSLMSAGYRLRQGL